MSRLHQVVVGYKQKNIKPIFGGGVILAQRKVFGNVFSLGKAAQVKSVNAAKALKFRQTLKPLNQTIFDLLVEELAKKPAISQGDLAPIVVRRLRLEKKIGLCANNTRKYSWESN